MTLRDSEGRRRPRLVRWVSAIAGVGSVLIAAAATAGVPVALKPEPTDADGVVTLGDLFDNAGAAAKVPVATRTSASVVLDAGAVQMAARRSGLDWPNAEGFRRIIVRSGAPEGAAPAGRGNIEVLAYARSLNVGEVVQPQDLVWTKAAAAPADAPADADAVIGLAARRPLRAGASVSARDLQAPIVIKTGDLVSVTFQDGGITLTLQAKAMSQAGLGEPVAVQNLLSKKTVQAVAAGPGQALVGPAADQFRASRAPQYALR